MGRKMTSKIRMEMKAFVAVPDRARISTPMPSVDVRATDIVNEWVMMVIILGHSIHITLLWESLLACWASKRLWRRMI